MKPSEIPTVLARLTVFCTENKEHGKVIQKYLESMFDTLVEEKFFGPKGEYDPRKSVPKA